MAKLKVDTNNAVW